MKNANTASQAKLLCPRPDKSQRAEHGLYGGEKSNKSRRIKKRNATNEPPLPDSNRLSARREEQQRAD